MDIYSNEMKKKARMMREAGYSLMEIGNKLHIAKSTASLWVREVYLNEKAKVRLQARKELGSQKGLQANKIRRDVLMNKIHGEVKKMISEIEFNTNLNKLLCAIFFWTEGGKYTNSFVNFINSDPIMIATFIKLFRKSFCVDERKFRALIHIHEYHNDKEIKRYWSKITNIPLNQFNRSYLKPHTGKRKRNDYHGCIRLSYYDARIAHELRSIYNTLSKQIGSVG